MRIYSMTATFGKLEHDTLTLTPGLNVIHAPNEWGKSTWCAFLVAMLYGIETRVHTTKTALADKERYAPWSGSPMSGRIDLSWNGRDITIERRTKGRSVFGQFRAYETETGLEIPELTAANCGQQLLGVEKSVFLRSGFIRLSDLPVTQDESLRRRLNAIVTTGDESGTADTLSQKLKDLKNRCRLNKSTGLLPQAEAQQRELQSKLYELRELQEQSTRTQQRLEQLEQHHGLLVNHRDALAYAANEDYIRALGDARSAETAAREQEARLTAECALLPQADAVENTLAQLHRLRDQMDALHMDFQLEPQPPQTPEQHPVFRNVTPGEALAQAELDAENYARSAGKKALPWYAAALLILGIAGLFLPHWAAVAAGVAGIVAGAVLIAVAAVQHRHRKQEAKLLCSRYAPLPPEQWVSAAKDYAASRKKQETAMEQWRIGHNQLEDRLSRLNRDIAAVAGEESLADCQRRYSEMRDRHVALSAARKELRRATELVRTLSGSHKDAPAPKFPDTMTYSEAETARLLSDCLYEQRQLQLKLGQYQGRMEALGAESALLQQLDRANRRIEALENTYSALEIAQSTLAQATAELQRRFAPRISGRAQVLFGKLTDGRYTRLTLDEELAVHAGSKDEDTLHSALWRSEGTVDQLYLALRIAMADELTPGAPLVLDDALVRFDDKRLAEALDVLAEEAETRQVILFTCQSREAKLVGTEKLETAL